MVVCDKTAWSALVYMAIQREGGRGRRMHREENVLERDYISRCQEVDYKHTKKYRNVSGAFFK